MKLKFSTKARMIFMALVILAAGFALGYERGSADTSAYILGELSK